MDGQEKHLLCKKAPAYENPLKGKQAFIRI
jgi:hypothetical protein